MLQNLRMRMVIIGELFGFLWRRKLWWMLPLVAMLMVLGILFALAASSSAIAPFIYTLF
jgi:hypothetical protein